jgi:hypothetical protein
MSVEVTERDVKAILGKRNIQKLKSFKLESLGDEKVIGFLGDHFILRVITDSIIYDFFLKAVPRNIQKRCEYLEETGFFDREIDIYQHFIPKLEQFSTFTWVAKCYMVKRNNFLVLENLKNYRIVKSQQLLLDLNHFMVNFYFTISNFRLKAIILDCITIYRINACIFNNLRGKGGKIHSN